MLHTIAAITAAWCRSLRLSVLSACVQLRQLREVHHNLQQALLTDAERTITTVHLRISDVTPARHAQGTLSILRAFVACAVVPRAVLVQFGAL